MFISEEEANKRLRSSKNVLTVVDKDSDITIGEAHTREPIIITPDEILPADVLDDDASCASASGIMAPEGAVLRKMLGLGLGRKKGQIELPKELQAAAAVTAQVVDTRTAAEAFGMSYHHADELKHGFTNQDARYGGADPDKDLEKLVTQQKKQVRDLAFEKLTKTLGLITDDKLTIITDAAKLSRVARDLSTVVEKTLPKEQTGLNGVHFHVWRPDMRAEESYEMVTVGGQR